MLRARAASWAVLDEDALLADGSFVWPLGMGAGRAVRLPLSDSVVLPTALEASPCCPWELVGTHGFELGGWELSSTPDPDERLIKIVLFHARPATFLTC